MNTRIYRVFFTQTTNMVVVYVLLIAYVLAINFYAFILVKTLRDNERKSEEATQSNDLTATNTPSEPPQQKYLRKLLITGALGGAITIYVCMLLLKWRKTDLVLMVVMPLLGVLNVYLWVLLFRYGCRFFVAV